MRTKSVNYDCVLMRTETGTAKMRSRTSDISPKLRAVLFLIDSKHTFKQLLERAGSLRELLESQIMQLIEIGLIEVESGHTASPPLPGKDIEATTPYAHHRATKAQDIPPLVAAKMQLLLRLESMPSKDTDALGAELLEAKNLKELAHLAKGVTAKLTESVGQEASQLFWSEAKKILTAWRDISVTSQMDAYQNNEGDK